MSCWSYKVFLHFDVAPVCVWRTAQRNAIFQQVEFHLLEARIVGMRISQLSVARLCGGWSLSRVERMNEPFYVNLEHFRRASTRISNSVQCANFGLVLSALFVFLRSPLGWSFSAPCFRSASSPFLPTAEQFLFGAPHLDNTKL